MANALFAKGKENLLAGNFALSSNNIKTVLVDHGTDTPNTSTDDALDDIGAGARVATSGNHASKTITDGVYDAADVTISAVSGASVESLVTYKDSGVEATSYLLVYHDTGTNLPFTPNSGDVTIGWSNGSSKIFAL